MRRNPDGTHSFYDLDDSWYRYLKSDREGRKQMCNDVIAAEGCVCAIALVGAIIFLVVAVYRGWI